MTAPVIPNVTSPLAIVLIDPVTGLAYSATAGAAPSVLITPAGGSVDEVSVNAAIVAMGAAGGGTVYIGVGTFKTSSPIVNYQVGVSVIGAGDGLSIIQPQAGWTAVNAPTTTTTIAGVVAFVGATYFECSGLTLDMSLLPSSANGIITVPFGTGPSDQFSLPCKHGKIHDNSVVSPAFPNYLYWNEKSQYMKWYDNFGDGGTTSPTAVVDQQGFEIFAGYDVEAYGNFMTNIGGNAYLVQTISSTFPNGGCEKIRIHHNAADVCYNGLMCQSTYDATNGPANLKEVEFDNNECSNIFHYGMYLFAATGNATNPPIWAGVNMHHNILRGATTAAGALTSTQGFFANNSASNTFSITAVTQANPGVFTLGANSLVVGDTVYVQPPLGMVEIQSGYYTVNTIPTPNSTVTLAFNGTALNTTTFTAYSSGGKIDPVLTNFEAVDINHNQFLDFAKTDSAALAQISSFYNLRFHNNAVRNLIAPVSGTNYSLIVNGFHQNVSVCDNEFDGAQRGSMYCDTGINLELRRNTCLNWNKSLGGFSAIYLNGAYDSVVTDNRMKTAFQTSIGSLVNLGAANGFVTGRNDYIGRIATGFTLYNFSTAINGNVGTTAAISNVATSFTVTTNRCTTTSTVEVYQVAGTTVRPPILTTPANGSFTVTVAVGTGDETYRWHIL